MGRGSYSWAICDQTSDLNPVISWNVVHPLGLCNPFSFGKNCFRLVGCRKITQEKIHPGQEWALTFPSQKSRSRERHRSRLSVSQVAHWRGPYFQAPNIALHKWLPASAWYTHWLVSFILGAKQFHFLGGGFFFSLSPSYHGHKMLMCQQAIAKLPHCHLPVQHLFFHVCQPCGFLPAVSAEKTLASNWSCLNKIVISILI